MKLSVALAVFNEAAAISHCLTSIYPLADEIVIVDGGSTDETLERVKELDKDKKVRVIHEKNPPMFHINKQKAIQACKGDWILQLDAGEVVSEELKREVEQTIEAHNGSTVAYWLPRLNYFLGKPLKKGGQYPDKTIRLYKNGVAHFPCKTVHEQVAIGGEVGELTSDLLHYPYATFTSYVDKWVRYSTLEAEEQYKNGMRPNMGNFISYMVIKPKLWFLKTYFRHKGFMDGFPGFIFSLFSSLRYWVEYIAIYEKSR